MRNPLKLYVFGLGMVMLLNGCALSSMVKKAKDQKITIAPSPLELRGDSVRFTLAATLPKGLLRKNKVYTIVPTYKYADQRIELQEFPFKASDYPNAKKEAVSASRTYAFAYNGEQMDKGDLVLIGRASGINGGGKKTQEINVAKGLVTTARLADLTAEPIQVASGYTTGDELEPTTVDFFFEQGESKLRTSEVKSTRGAFLDNFIAGKNVTKTVSITGSHSPEGREAKNVTLSDDRAKEIEKYYRKRIAALDYAATPKKGKGKKKAKATAATPGSQIQFVTKSLIEDWRPFKDSLAAYTGISEAEKTQVVTIVDGAGSFTDKEAQIEQLPFFAKLFVDLYPKLRFAQAEILVLAQKKSEAEIALLAKEAAQGNATSAKRLSDKELSYAASQTPILAEKEAIYQAATKKNDLWESHNNLGAVRIMQAMALQGEERNAKLTQASTNLQIAANKKANPVTSYNQAVVALLQGNRPQATQLVTQAEGQQPDPTTVQAINTVKGPLLIYNGKYDEAEAALRNSTQTPASQYNLGLVQLLKKDYTAASTSLQQATSGQPQNTRYHYVQAVLGARTKASSQIGQELKAASGDATLRQRALSDIEFEKVRDSESYKNGLR